MSSITLQVTGMTCAACVRRVERALAAVPGVGEVSVNLATERATVESAAATAQPDVDSLLATVARAGYGATAVGRDAPLADTRAPGWPVLLAALLTVPLVAPMLLRLFGLDAQLLPLVQWALATPVQFGLGARFYRSAWNAVRARAGNMDLLVAIGTSAAYGLSIWQWLSASSPHGAHLYFEASAGVITLVLLGKWLEGQVKRRTTEALRALDALRPQVARVRRDGADLDLPIAQVRVGDAVVVLPGDRIAVDGEIVEGRGHVDEALVTGESRPRACGPGDFVTGGAINLEAALLVRTTAVGTSTRLARIIRMVESAQAAKAPIQRTVDRVSEVFVPIVLVIAAITFVGWTAWNHDVQLALINAVSVLVIACPCALGLATPAAIMAGTGAAARRGIVIRDAEVLERAHAVTTVAFDKTGTLTEGRPRLLEIVAGAAMSRDEALRHAAALQRSSRHPLARAVIDAATGLDGGGLTVEGATALAGLGIEARIDGQVFMLGNRRLAEQAAAHGLAGFEDSERRFESQGATLSWLLRGTGDRAEAVALLAFGDPLKAQSRQAIQRLRARGIRTVMLSGDQPASAEPVARALGIDESHAGILPGGKAEVITALRAGGAVVAMVGDGINDAPALAAAAVGIAMASGTDVAIETAGITLMRDDPRGVAEAIELSSRTVAKIRQNLGWAFGYNVLGIPLAAFGYLSPVVAGAAMALSSVSVITNALLLRRSRHPEEST
ncbi:heavy metal translocating P-type ATPase [soil metagenome]